MMGYALLLSILIGWILWTSQKLKPSLTFKKGLIVCVFLFLWSLVYTFILIYKQAPNMPWYYVSTIYFGYLVICTLIMNRKLTGFIKTAYGLIIVTVILNASVAINISESFKNGLVDKRGHEDRREKIGRYLHDKIPNIENKTLLLFEAGKIPYYSNAKCIDLLGLVSREGIDGLAMGDTSSVLIKTFPDFIAGVNNPEYFPMKFLGSAFFKDHYFEWHKIDDYYIWRKRDGDSGKI
jgi:hypothetical protein